MSEKWNDKEKAAMRLFGALSGVEEEYLAACEADKGFAKTGGIVVFMRKYGKAVAAVLCLALLGIGYFGVQYGGVSLSDKKAARDESSNEACAQTQAPAGWAESEPEVMYAPPMPSQENSVEDYKEAMMDGFYKNESISGTASNEVREEGFEQSDAAHLQMPAENGKDSYMQEMSLEEAQAVPIIGKYVPADWPEGGSLEEIVGQIEPATEEIGEIHLYWTIEDVDVSDYILVSVSKTEGAISEEDQRKLRAGLAVMAEDFTREFLEENLKTSSESASGTPRGQFSIFYQEGDCYVTVYFYGYGDADRVWELLQ